MKILHVFDHSIPLHSGYTFRSKAILEHQRLRGWETDHLTSPKHNEAITPTSDEESIDGLHFFRSHTPNGLSAKLPMLNQWAIVKSIEQRLDEVIPQVKPDIIHAHSPVLNGLAAVRAAKKYGIPVVYEIRAFWEDAAVDHGSTAEGSLRYKFTKALETYVVKQANAVTTICEGLRSDLINRGISTDKITVIPNAVDITRFNTDRNIDTNLQDKLGLSKAKVIGFIGSFYGYEGLSLLIDALPLIRREISDVKLLLVGGGPQEANIKQLVIDNNLSDYVIFTGRVPHNEVQAYYDLVDVFVYPRLSMRLTELVTPLKPLEAMAQKRLVVASDVGGHKELIENNKNGVLFKAGNREALAKTVVNLFNKPETWSDLRKSGRRYVEEQRNWPNSVAHYETIYSHMVK